MSKASELTNQIIDYLYRNNCYAWKSTSTGLYDDKLQRFRMASKKGVSDILAVLPPSGRLIAIEVKIGRDRMRPEQIGFFRNIEHIGGLTFVAKDFDSFKEWWNERVVSL